MKALLLLAVLALPGRALPPITRSFNGANVVDSLLVDGGGYGVLPSDAVLFSSGTLIVQSTSATAGHQYLQLRDNTGAVDAVFTQDGRLGIGTSVPNTSSLVHVRGNVFSDSTSGATEFRLRRAGVDKWGIFNSLDATDAFGLYAYDATAGTRLHITQAGLVGITTTSPATNLHVVGTTGVRSSTSTTSGTHSTNLGARDAAPGTCVVGDEYTDVSGAKCFCDAANNWIEMGTGTGSCT